jgi:hypothetical protein
MRILSNFILVHSVRSTVLFTHCNIILIVHLHQSEVKLFFIVAFTYFCETADLRLPQNWKSVYLKYALKMFSVLLHLTNPLKPKLV